MASVRSIIFILVALALSSSIQRSFSLRNFPIGASSASGDSGGACWNAIKKVEGCESEIHASAKRSEIEVSYECCKVIVQGLPAKCAAVISAGGEFSAEFGSAVNEYCDGMGITMPLIEEEDKAQHR